MSQFKNFSLQPDELNDIQSKACKRSLYVFVRTFWDVVIAEEPIWNWHIGSICQELQKVGELVFSRSEKENDLVINIPPGTTKSTICTIMFPAWLWCRDPSIRIISNSNASSLSTEHAIKTRDIVLSDLYKSLFPEVEIRKDKSGKQSYDTTKNGARYTTSTGGTIIGKHAHVILNDDPQDPAQAESEAHRKQAVDHTKALATRKVDKKSTVTITIMQRLNVEDVSGYLLSKKGERIKHIRLPATYQKNNPPSPEQDKYQGKTLKEWYLEGGGYLDPIRLGQDALDESLVDLGTRG